MADSYSVLFKLSSVRERTLVNLRITVIVPLLWTLISDWAATIWEDFQINTAIVVIMRPLILSFISNPIKYKIWMIGWRVASRSVASWSPDLELPNKWYWFRSNNRLFYCRSNVPSTISADSLTSLHDYPNPRQSGAERPSGEGHVIGKSRHVTNWGDVLIRKHRI